MFIDFKMVLGFELGNLVLLVLLLLLLQLLLLF